MLFVSSFPPTWIAGKKEKTKMGGTLTKFAHDVEVKKQVVTVAIVGLLITSIEAYLYYYVLTPEVRGGIKRMLHRNKPVLEHDAVAQEALRIALTAAHSREDALVRKRTTTPIIVIVRR